MVTLYQQITQLITNTPGNILYHLVVAFSILGSTQAALNLWRQGNYPQAKRMVVGFCLLLISRLLLSVAAVLSFTGIISPHILLPNLDRAIMTFNIVIILWLWVFPEPTRIADAVSGSLSILIAVAFVLLQSWWSINSKDLSFNNTFAATAWDIFAFILMGIGIFLFVIRLPNGWGYGLVMILMLLTGQILQFIFPNLNDDFPGAIRLFEMAAYPLLWTLPTRFNLPKSKSTLRYPLEDRFLSQGRAKNTIKKERNSIDPKLFRDTLLLLDQTTEGSFGQKFTKLMAEAMKADFCFLLLPPDDLGQISIPWVYDQKQNTYLSNQSLDSQNVPLLMKAMGQGRPIRLPASSTSKDINHIIELLDLEKAVQILAAFIPSTDQEFPQMGILMLSSNPEYHWNRDDQALINSIAITMAPILQQTQYIKSLIKNFQASELDTGTHQIPIEESLPDTGGDRGKVEETTFMVRKIPNSEKDKLFESFSDPGEEIQKLREENLLLQRKVKTLSESLEQQAEKPRQLREELKLALTEIAQLRNQFFDIEKSRRSELPPPERNALQLSTLEKNRIKFITKRFTEDQINGFTTVMENLRQPVSSIIGYTDLLLSESAGILDAVQKKFLERIKSSVKRMDTFLNDLIHIVSKDILSKDLHQKKVKLEDAIDVAIAETQHQFQERGIVLRLDLADEIPQFLADQDALEQILIYLLKNAGTASPVNGEIFLRTSIYQVEDNQKYILIQVSDQGGGIPIDEQPRVFSRFYQAENETIPGTGKSNVSLSIVKILVEAHHGRIWVDTELGKGSTITLLLPLDDNNNNQNHYDNGKGI